MHQPQRDVQQLLTSGVSPELLYPDSPALKPSTDQPH